MRSQVRDLIKFLKTEEQKTVETNFKDEIIEKDSKHINPQAVTKLLGEYLLKYNFNPAQEEFLHQIVTYVLQNGDIEVKNLIKDDPFKSLDFTELFEGNVVPVT